MFDVSASNLQIELSQAIELRDTFLIDYEERLARMAGPGYHHAADAGDDPENHAFEWLSLMAPQLTHQAPQVTVSTTRLGEAREKAKAHQFALNRWVKDANLVSTIEKLVSDYGMRWAIALTQPVPRPGYEESDDPDNWPQIRRVSPRRFIWDPQATEWDDSRFFAHMVIRDREDLLAEADQYPDRGWNKDAIASLGENSGLPDYMERRNDRGQVVYYEFWIPELYLGGREEHRKNGEHGTILTVGYAEGSTGKEAARGGEYLREPYPFFGPRWGPYTPIGGYVVPDTIAPLSPVVATQSQADHLNNVSRALYDGAHTYKNIALVSQGDPELAVTIKDGQHDNVYTTNLDDLSKAVVKLELGGITQQHLALKEEARGSLDRNSGISEAQRGNVEGVATATENALAATAGNIRTGHHVSKFKNGLARALQTVSWYMEMDPSIKQPMGQGAVGVFVDQRTGQPIEAPVLEGGLAEGQTPEDFDALEFTVEMFGPREKQARQQALDHFSGFYVPLIAQFPFVEWEEVLEMLGDATGIRNLQGLVNVDAARALFTQGMMQEYQDQQQEPQPRLGQDRSGVPGGVGSGGGSISPRGMKNEAASRTLGRNGTGPDNGSAQRPA